MEGSQSILLFAAASRQIWHGLDCRLQGDPQDTGILHRNPSGQLLNPDIVKKLIDCLNWGQEEKKSRDRVNPNPSKFC